MGGVETGSSVGEFVGGLRRRDQIVIPEWSQRAVGMLAVTTAVLVLWPASSYSMASAMSLSKREALRDDVRHMFRHAYNNYMRYAFPHDELKPLSRTYTDSLGELGNLKLEHLSKAYNGSALTLVDSLTSLAILGYPSEFEKAINWLAENLTFAVDIRVNLFECNIRVLGSLISAHLLAADPNRNLMSGGYKGQLLHLAEDLGHRFLAAFDTPSGIPYAWVNLEHGVMKGETAETSTSGCGSLILEMGALSRLTGNPRYEAAALHALRKLWSMRSHLNLMGTTLDVETGEWIEHSSGIGAGEEYWNMFRDAYVAVQQHFRQGPWYHDADMRTGGGHSSPANKFASLLAGGPGASHHHSFVYPSSSEVLIGDIGGANMTHREFVNVWQRYGVLPERYLFDRQEIHPTERYYPLRPELAESTYFLFQATKDPWYLSVGQLLVNSLNIYTRVSGGFASVRDVMTMELEDHQHSFFLSETSMSNTKKKEKEPAAEQKKITKTSQTQERCKYLFLLFDDTFLAGQNYIFTTEGHPLPVLRSWQQWEPSIEKFLPPGKEEKKLQKVNALDSRTCPNLRCNGCKNCTLKVESACHILDERLDHTCQVQEDCGIDASSCRRRFCSGTGYCGTWPSRR